MLTLFPDAFKGPLDISIVGRARERGLVDIHTWDIRDFSQNRHRTVDDYPYGGGAGMVMQVEPIAHAVSRVRMEVSQSGVAPGPLLYMSASGAQWKQEEAQRFSSLDHLMIMCGHYEGIDQRAIDLYVDYEFSIGDFVLSGGEIPALAIVDSMVRLIPGALGAAESTMEESFSYDGLLEYPQYTRPPEYAGRRVPDVLLNGNHGLIASWRRAQAIARTKTRRPDLLPEARLTPGERARHLQTSSIFAVKGGSPDELD